MTGAVVDREPHGKMAYTLISPWLLVDAPMVVFVLAMSLASLAPCIAPWLGEVSGPSELANSETQILHPSSSVFSSFAVRSSLACKFSEHWNKLPALLLALGWLANLLMHATAGLRQLPQGRARSRPWAQYGLKERARFYMLLRVLHNVGATCRFLLWRHDVKSQPLTPMPIFAKILLNPKVHPKSDMFHAFQAINSYVSESLVSSHMSILLHGPISLLNSTFKFNSNCPPSAETCFAMTVPVHWPPLATSTCVLRAIMPQGLSLPLLELGSLVDALASAIYLFALSLDGHPTWTLHRILVGPLLGALGAPLVGMMVKLGYDHWWGGEARPAEPISSSSASKGGECCADSSEGLAGVSRSMDAAAAPATISTLVCASLDSPEAGGADIPQALQPAANPGSSSPSPHGIGPSKDYSASVAGPRQRPRHRPSPGAPAATRANDPYNMIPLTIAAIRADVDRRIERQVDLVRSYRFPSQTVRVAVKVRGV